jgi:hypothetical protein
MIEQGGAQAVQATQAAGERMAGSVQNTANQMRRTAEAGWRAFNEATAQGADEAAVRAAMLAAMPRMRAPASTTQAGQVSCVWVRA